MHLHLLAATPAISVFYDAKNDWLYLDWQGDLDLKSVQAGCSVVAECFLRKNYVRVLNDNSNVTSLSPEVASWLATDFLPYIRLTTIEYIAWTYSPSVDTQFWTNSALQQIDKPMVAMFDDVESAYAWLREVKFRFPGFSKILPAHLLEAKRQIRNQLDVALSRSEQRAVSGAAVIK